MNVKKVALEKSPEKIHSQDVVFKIILPIVLALAVFLGLGILAIVAPATAATSTEQWANISAIFLILPVLFLGLIYIGILVLSYYLFFRVNKALPPGLRKIRNAIDRISKVVQSKVTQAATPMIAVKSTVTGGKILFSKARQKVQKQVPTERKND